MNDYIYNEAITVINNRRFDSERACEEKRQELKNSIPELREIMGELEKTSTLVLASFSKAEGSPTFEEIKCRNLELQKRKREILVSRGYPEDYDLIKYHCEKCSDSGYVDLKMCSCLKAELSKIRLEKSEISRLGEKQGFDNFSLDYYSASERENMAFNFDVLKSFAENFTADTKDNWLLIGNTGLGKTHLSTSVGSEVIRRGYNVIYKSIQGIISDMERVQFSHEDPSITEPYFECDLLIIDDLGTEMSNQFTRSVVYNIINSRLSAEKPMLINTNLDQKELREMYADRITSRLFGEFKPLLFKGTDIRRLKLQNEN